MDWTKPGNGWKPIEDATCDEASRAFGCPPEHFALSPSIFPSLPLSSSGAASGLALLLLLLLLFQESLLIARNPDLQVLGRFLEFVAVQQTAAQRLKESPRADVVR
jgi:hypothetical protein